MKTLSIVWQRLVDDQGQTCPRCGSTGREIEAAVATLTRMLAPLDVRPVLEIRDISEEQFVQTPAESNRIWIGGCALEQWLGASVGSSECCDACGDAQCRTMEIQEQVHEVIPENLILKAGLLAAARMQDAGPVSDCCS